MKKSFKRLLSVLLCVVICMSCMVTAFAGGSPYFPCPSMTAGHWSGASTEYKCYSAAKTATGENAYMYFDKNTYATLQSNFSDNSNRKLEVQLNEADPAFHDVVKKYVGNFQGRKLNYIYLSQTVESGNIETYGDNCAELYMAACVSKMSGDPQNPSIASGLFKCSVGMK